MKEWRMTIIISVGIDSGTCLWKLTARLIVLFSALVNSEGAYLFNGDFIVSIFHKEIPVKNTLIDYTGSDTIVERINCTDAVGEKLKLYVCSGPTKAEIYVIMA